MGRPNKQEREKLKSTMERLVAQGLSTNEIGRMTGKSGQAVHQYLQHHNMMTVEMKRRSELNLDKDTDLTDNGEGNKENIDG